MEPRPLRLGKSVTLERFLLTAVFIHLLAMAYCSAGLATYSRQHFMLAGLPIYVGEIALLLVAWVAVLRRSVVPYKDPFFLALAGYLAVAVIRAVLEGFQNELQFSLGERLRGLALFYQSFWVFLGICLHQKEARALLVAVGSVAFLKEFWSTCVLISTAFGYTPSAGFISQDLFYANEYVSLVMLFPPIVLQSGMAAFFSGAGLGRIIFMQTFVYFRKAWCGSFLLVSMGYAFIALHQRRNQSSALARQLTLAAAGLAVVFSTLIFVVNQELKRENLVSRTGLKAQLELVPVWKGGSRELAPDSDRATRLQGGGKERILEWAFHGDTDPDSKGGQEFMGWRRFLWRQAFYGTDDFFWGQGFGQRMVVQNTGVVPVPLVADGKWTYGPHNALVAVYFRAGLLGTFFFLWLLGSWLYRTTGFLSGWGRVASTGWLELGVFSTAMAVSLLVYALTGVVLESPQGATWFWIFVGLSYRSLSNHSHGERLRTVF